MPENERDFEFLMNALRLRSGFELRTYAVRTHGDMQALLGKLDPLISKGWLQHDGTVIRATDTGFRFLDSILLECCQESV